jgi:hypothetical protein
MTFSAGFECAKGWPVQWLVPVVEMACIFADWSTTTTTHQSTEQICSTTTNQQNMFALAINTCWQNFYDMCVTPANMVEEHLQHLQHLAGCIGTLKTTRLRKSIFSSSGKYTC